MITDRTTAGPGRPGLLLAAVAVAAFVAGGIAGTLFSRGDAPDPGPVAVAPDPAPVVGVVETVRITGPTGESVEVEPRIDTGAAGSSMDDDIAAELGFDLEDADSVRVSSALGTEERPVVKGRVQLGEEEKTVRLSVTDRDERKSAVLIGRRDLAGMQVEVPEDDD